MIAACRSAPAAAGAETPASASRRHPHDVVSGGGGRAHMAPHVRWACIRAGHPIAGTESRVRGRACYLFEDRWTILTRSPALMLRNLELKEFWVALAPRSRSLSAASRHGAGHPVICRLMP